MSNHHSQLKKHLKVIVNLETSSYDFLTKTYSRKTSDVPKYLYTGYHFRMSFNDQKLFAEIEERKKAREQLMEKWKNVVQVKYWKCIVKFE